MLVHGSWDLHCCAWRLISCCTCHVLYRSELPYPLNLRSWPCWMDVQQALYHSIQKKLCALPPSGQLKSIPFWELVEGLSQNLGIIQWFSVGSDFYPDPHHKWTLGSVWRCRSLSQMGWGCFWPLVNRSQSCCWAFYSAEHSPHQRWSLSPKMLKWCQGWETLRRHLVKRQRSPSQKSELKAQPQAPWNDTG